MGFQTEFSRAVFGGLKEKQVITYIEKLEQKHESELSARQAQIDSLNSQLTELKSIVDEQYQKIVEASDENAKLKTELDSKKQENSNILEQLAIFEKSQQDVQRIISQAKIKSEQILAEAHNGAEQFTMQANQLLDTARKKAQDILDGAKNKEFEILENAKDKAKKNIILSEKNELRSRKLIEDAQKEANDIINNANTLMKDKQDYFDSCLKTFQTKKKDLLIFLEDLKKEIESYEITGVNQNCEEERQDLRRLKIDALRNKFSTMNQKNMRGE